jgi:Family of unknown function (DUF6353)
MQLFGLAQKVRHAKFLVQDNSTTVLTGMAVTGTITTAYLTGRASFKAAQIIEEERHMIELREEGRNEQPVKIDLAFRSKVQLTWRLFVPPVGMGALTISTIIAANKMASKKIAALTVASGISERALQEYKAKVVERLGEKENRKIHDRIAQEHVDRHPVGREVILAGTGEVLCYDMTTGRYFMSSVEEIKKAENKVNHELNNFLSASLSSFYDEIGLPATSFSDNVGWNANNQVEVVFSTTMSQDQRPCIAIDFVHPPFSDYHRAVYD